MNSKITIDAKIIEPGRAFIIAELSANHNQEYGEAVRLIRAAKECGADAVKLQTYTPDTLTIDCDNKYFRIGTGTIWEGKTLYELYKEAYTPWEWQPKLQKIAHDLGLTLFSTPFDISSIEFLASMNVPAYKIASFELVDLALIRAVALKKKPMIISTGMANLEEIRDAVDEVKNAGCEDLILLKCTSAYPAPPAEMNLKTIPDLAKRFSVPVGISDHTLGISVPISAVALGACVIEKHLTFSRNTPGPDNAFSLEPHEFRKMVEQVRITESAMGTVCYEVMDHERASLVFRRSLFAVKNIRKGEIFDNNNIRSIRPGYGIAPKYLPAIVGRTALQNITAGTPIEWAFVSK